MKYLIDGRAGTGKSYICKELIARGIDSDDGDRIPGLASWVDLSSGQKVKVDASKYVDESEVDWLWNKDVLENWLSSPGERFLCGSAGNDLDFFNRFTKVFVLKVDPETHAARLRDRESAYAKDPEMIAHKIIQQKEFFSKAMKMGAIMIDNTKTIDKVVDEIIETVNG